MLNMVSYLLVKYCIVSNVFAMSMCWSIIVSMSLSWVKKNYSVDNFCVHVWDSEKMKIMFSELFNPKDPYIICDLGKYQLFEGIIA